MPSAAIWTGTPSIKGSSESVRMALLTLSLIGIQFTWGLEMTYCTPYLLELGLTKSMVSLVWIAGPLSGLIMQPIVGVIADRSTSRYGRRRPFMLIGASIVTLALFMLGWTKEIVAHLVAGDSTASKPLRIFLAVLSIYAVDFAINAVQASTRSLIVDTLPVSKQQLGSAWASRMVAVGTLIGYGAGAVDLKSMFGEAIGDSQFKQLTVVSAIMLCTTVGMTCWAVTERVLVDDGKGDSTAGPLEMFKQILSAATNLPPRIAAICRVQFWCWIGWFPFLFYSTTWVGEIYLRYNATEEQREHPDTLGQIGRMGSLSLIVFSIVTFLSSIMLPWFVRSPDQEKSEFTPRPPESLKGLLELAKWKPTLLQAWTYSHLIFASTMICAPFVQSLRAATVLVAFCGIPWAFNCWAPFTFMGVEINKLATSQAAHRRHSSVGSMVELEAKASLLAHPSDDETSASSSSSDLAGIYLGILNLYTTLPQFIGTFISWVVFSVLEPGKSPELAKEAHPDEHHSTDGPNAIAVCLFIGAVAAVGASYATRRLKALQ